MTQKYAERKEKKKNVAEVRERPAVFSKTRRSW